MPVQTPRPPNFRAGLSVSQGGDVTATRGSSRDDNLWAPSPKTAEEQRREAESSLASPGHGAEHAARLKVRTLTKLYNTPPA